ncbi:hypothetical protein CBA19CS91_11875 [Paraburkholderia hospita]|jgi:hypothetical protein|nr:hypothetical protein CBA19CS91_11875 [Paraburkholderia hospita]
MTRRLEKQKAYEECRWMVLLSHMICAYALEYKVSSLESENASITRGRCPDNARHRQQSHAVRRTKETKT